MDRPGPLISGPLTQTAREVGYRGAAGRLAERRVPGAVLGEQRRHLGETAVIQSETVLRQDLSDRLLLLDRGRHPSLLRSSVADGDIVGRLPNCGQAPAAGSAHAGAAPILTAVKAQRDGLPIAPMGGVGRG